MLHVILSKINDSGYARLIIYFLICSDFIPLPSPVFFFFPWHSSSPCCPSWSHWSGSTLPISLPMAAASLMERTSCLVPLAALHLMESQTTTPNWPIRWDVLTLLSRSRVNSVMRVKCVWSMMCWHCIGSDYYSRVTWAIHRHHLRLFLPPRHLWTARKWSMDLPQQKSLPAKLLPWVNIHEDVSKCHI